MKLQLTNNNKNEDITTRFWNKLFERQIIQVFGSSKTKGLKSVMVTHA
jgi:hypothetical protein